jgi:hypothetical protein
MKPFVDFYNQENINPVRQNLTNINLLKRRRTFLYSKLGINLKFLTGKEILEFGPGGGFNSIITSSYAPMTYDYVDASTKSIEVLRENKKIKAKNSNIYNIFT